MLWLVAPLGAIAFVDTGGLIAYGPSYANLARRGASYVDRISRGIQARGSPGRTADQVRTADQPQYRQGTRPDNSAPIARACRRGH
jgi:hypothetical protein